ncbi:hypothetical protein ACQ86N_33930 [Puia sp. P3]|uniref:hypothetical protein n=1 Tax=Puia sp. P3 TaxID=3423952 RepID=UPI003D67ADE2
MVGQFFDVCFYFLYCGGDGGEVVAGGQVLQKGDEPGHLFFECVEGLIAVKDADRFAGKHFAGVVADAAAGGTCGQMVDLVPFLFGEADVEAAEPEFSEEAFM